MKKKFKLGVIGAGFMATAIIKGVISSKILLPEQICVSDVNAQLLEKMQELGVSATCHNEQLVAQSEFVLFAIKPQSLNGVLDQIENCECEKAISIMAGVKKDKIKSRLKKVLVARCMPNTPCSIGSGAVGLDLTDFTSNEDKSFIKELFESIAEVVIVEEKDLNAVTGISGSSPAYFYLFLKSIIESGVKQGLNYEQAKNLATSTMIGAGKMVLANPDKTIDELINAVCSKGGTTIEAVKVFNEEQLSIITDKAVTACVHRAMELENL